MSLRDKKRALQIDALREAAVNASRHFIRGRYWLPMLVVRRARERRSQRESVRLVAALERKARQQFRGPGAIAGPRSVALNPVENQPGVFAAPLPEDFVIGRLVVHGQYPIHSWWRTSFWLYVHTSPACRRVDVFEAEDSRRW